MNPLELIAYNECSFVLALLNERHQANTPGKVRNFVTKNTFYLFFSIQFQNCFTTFLGLSKTQVGAGLKRITNQS